MTPSELVLAARRCRYAKQWHANGSVSAAMLAVVVADAAVLAEAYLDNKRADASEPVSAAAMRQEPGWAAAADANCFDHRDCPLRVWPNTGRVEFGAVTLLDGGATLGDVRKLAAVLCGEGRA